MKYKDWSDFKIYCSCISKLLPQPVGFKALKVQEVNKWASLLAKEILTETESKDLEYLNTKNHLHLNPTELCVGAHAYLIDIYGREKYGIRRATSNGTSKSSVSKGFALEKEGLELLSKLDNIEYTKELQSKSDDYFIGLCDILCPTGNNLIDIKTSWNAANFMKVKKDGFKLPIDMWSQMQGYLHLYKLPKGQVCFVLVNTPQHLVDQEKANLFRRYSFGEITKEKYDMDNFKLEGFFDYTKIPEKRRVVRFDVEYSKQFIDKAKNKVDLARIWLNKFDKSFMSQKNIPTYAERYMQSQEETQSNEIIEL
jgi:hypothetical protein